jgi:hypothetical protein
MTDLIALSPRGRCRQFIHDLVSNIKRLKRLYEREFAEDDVSAVAVSDPEPAIMTQLDYRGEPEKVNTSAFSNKLICKCGGVRYVKKQDLFQIAKCKPCTMRDRNARRKKGHGKES